jgi:hypothetical protein
MKGWGVAMAVLAAGLLGQEAPPEPVGLLESIKAHVGEGLRRLPNYTCLQTIERYERERPRREFVLMDRLRLEVALVEGKEYFAWPGESRFEVSRITKLVPGGTIGNGNFALHAYNVFLSTTPEYVYRGQTQIRGRPVIRYDFRVPREKSGYTLRVSERQAVVGFHGSFYVDRETLELVRLEVVADDIPAFLGVEHAADSMEYRAVRIGGAEFVLPAGSELLLRDADGSERRNVTSFSRCRQYTGESVVSFTGLLEEGDGGRGPAAARRVVLPAGVTVGLALETALDSAQAAVGDAIEARVTGDVKRDGVLLIPKGARVRGRITRLVRLRSPGPYFELGLRFHRVEFAGGEGEFTAELEAVLTPGGISTVQSAAGRLPNVGGRRAVVVVLEPEEGPGSGLLIVSGTRLQLPKGLQMVWRTKSVKEAEQH